MSDINIKGINFTDLRTEMLNSDEFFEIYNNYTGTSQNSANEALKKVLNDEEMNQLYYVIHDRKGWYCCTTGIYTNKLKIIAYALRFTDMNFCHDDEKLFKNIMQLILEISENEEMLLKSVYIKQKLITYKNLCNNKENNLVLWRGIKKLDSEKKYVSCNLESWTSNPDRAMKIAGKNGFVLKSTFNIEDVLVYNKSVFKHPTKKNPDSSMYIKRDYEYIIESNNRIIPLEFGKNIFRYGDYL